MKVKFNFKKCQVKHFIWISSIMRSNKFSSWNFATFSKQYQKKVKSCIQFNRSIFKHQMPLKLLSYPPINNFFLLSFSLSLSLPHIYRCLFRKMRSKNKSKKKFKINATIMNGNWMRQFSSPRWAQTINQPSIFFLPFSIFFHYLLFFLFPTMPKLLTYNQAQTA